MGLAELLVLVEAVHLAGLRAFLDSEALVDSAGAAQALAVPVVTGDLVTVASEEAVVQEALAVAVAAPTVVLATAALEAVAVAILQMVPRPAQDLREADKLSLAYELQGKVSMQTICQ